MLMYFSYIDWKNYFTLHLLKLLFPEEDCSDIFKDMHLLVFNTNYQM